MADTSSERGMCLGREGRRCLNTAKGASVEAGGSGTRWGTPRVTRLAVDMRMHAIRSF